MQRTNTSGLAGAQVALAGFTEVLTWVLHSHEENFAAMNLPDDGKTAVIVGNPRSADFEVSASAPWPNAGKREQASQLSIARGERDVGRVSKSQEYFGVRAVSSEDLT